MNQLYNIIYESNNGKYRRIIFIDSNINIFLNIEG